jgi:hypothetical protein
VIIDACQLQSHIAKCLLQWDYLDLGGLVGYAERLQQVGCGPRQGWEGKLRARERDRKTAGSLNTCGSLCHASILQCVATL